LRKERSPEIETFIRMTHEFIVIHAIVK
jgi:hypothetical protein